MSARLLSDPALLASVTKHVEAKAFEYKCAASTLAEFARRGEVPGVTFEQLMTSVRNSIRMQKKAVKK